MPDNSQKTPFGRSLHAFTRRVAGVATHIMGKSVPATIGSISGAIVQANYEVTATPGADPVVMPTPKMPVLGSRYWRPAYQPGEKGFALSADFFLGGMSGLGGGVSDLTQRGNLTTSVWAAIGHVDWPHVDPNTSVATGGPNGLILRDSEGNSATITMTSTSIVMTIGAASITMNSAGIALTGTLTSNGHDISNTHLHTKVQTGGSLSGPPQ